MAIGQNAFLFLTEAVVGAEGLYQDEFYIRRIHNLIADFLTLMPMKVSCRSNGRKSVVPDFHPATGFASQVFIQFSAENKLI